MALYTRHGQKILFFHLQVLGGAICLRSINQIGENVGLFLDRKKNKAIVQDKTRDKYYKKTVFEEHISLVKELNSSFLGHVTLFFGTGKIITDSLKAYLNFNGHLNLSTITAIECNEKSTNTGNYNSAIASIEKYLIRPLQ